MEIRSYCYTRGDKPDYRDFSIPENLTKADKIAVKNLVLPILNGDVEKPVWVLYKTPEVVVWGICCNNGKLSNSYNKDEIGRKVKGFFALVISAYSNDRLIVPYDISFFENLYKKEVVPYWDCRKGESHQSQTSDISDISYHSVSAAENNYVHRLNTDEFQIKRLSDTNANQIIAAALTIDKVTLTIGYDCLDNTINNKTTFMNCVVDGKKERTVKVRRLCPICHRQVEHLVPNGICDACARQEREQHKLNQEGTNGDDEMKDKMIEDLKRKLRECEFEMEEKNKTIKSQKRAVLFLAALCGLLLILSLWVIMK